MHVAAEAADTMVAWQGYPAAAGDSAIARSFAEQGFLLLPEPLWGPGLLEAAVEGMNMVIAGDNDTGSAVGSPGRVGSFEPGALIKLENPQYSSRGIRSLLGGARWLGERVARMTGAGWVQIWHVQLLAKPSLLAAAAAADSSVGWHQDRHYHSGDWADGSEILTAWIALSDVNSDSGPMRFVDGSHRWGLLSADGNDFFGQDLPSQRSSLEHAAPAGAEWTETPVLLPRGGCSVHDDFTIHGSEANTSGGTRRSLVCHMRTNRSVLRSQTVADRSTERSIADSGRYSASPPVPAAEGHEHEELEVCPVIFGAEAFEAQRRRERRECTTKAKM